MTSLGMAMQAIIILDYAAILVSLFFFAVGSVFDLKTREVDDKVWIGYGLIGLALTIVRLRLDPSTLVLTIVSIVLTTLISFGLFYFGLFGGADAKAIICLGLTIPLPPRGFLPLTGYFHPVFPVVVVVVSFICSAFIAIWYGLRNSLIYMAEGRHMFEGLESESRWRKTIAMITGYRADLSRLISTFYLYPMEEVVEDSEGSHRHLKLYVSAEADRDQLVSKFSNAVSKVGIKGKVWVTPGLPMLLFILVGLIVTLVVGDIVFSTIFFLAAGQHRLFV